MNAPGRDREDLAAFVLRLRSERIADTRLIEAVEAVPRRLFVPKDVPNAYGDHSLPIDCGETMPSALKAVRLVDALRLEAGHRVLEVGTGSGYVTALLSRLARKVVSMERYRRLIEAAESRLKLAGGPAATIVREDGREGYPQMAPFDRIIVHAAYEAVPRRFLEQLVPHGIAICAVGPGDGAQNLVRLTKVGSRFEREDIGTVRYQPLAFGTAAML
ncbi:protein-L-isoaspartate(D-aspartate) O-methyltransferase [Mangrovicella endophytica]|uniref:protein-L-isoaspartate(D-aspartate) O-methyltransferase n=1 Tax=Mangrovicella endophytica TaxID=2066697 RepID=UPI000C9E32AF|nr:protein-L-isoaspartate(D-aspartate) O-methyltransferase [Mangrovicella endophytica]